MQDCPEPLPNLHCAWEFLDQINKDALQDEEGCSLRAAFRYFRRKPLYA